MKLNKAPAAPAREVTAMASTCGPVGPNGATVRSGLYYEVDGIPQALEGEPPVASGGIRYKAYSQTT